LENVGSNVFQKKGLRPRKTTAGQVMTERGRRGCVVRNGRGEDHFPVLGGGKPFRMSWSNGGVFGGWGKKSQESPDGAPYEP